MDLMNVGLDVLEMTMRVGSSAIEQINQLLQVHPEPENPPISCQVSKCTW